MVATREGAEVTESARAGRFSAITGGLSGGVGAFGTLHNFPGLRFPVSLDAVRGRALRITVRGLGGVERRVLEWRIPER